MGWEAPNPSSGRQRPPRSPLQAREPWCPPEPPASAPSTPRRTQVPLQEGQSRLAGDVQTLVGVQGAPRVEDAVDELPSKKGEVSLALVHGSPGTGKGSASVGAGERSSCWDTAHRCSQEGTGGWVPPAPDSQDGYNFRLAVSGAQPLHFGNAFWRLELLGVDEEHRLGHLWVQRVLQGEHPGVKSHRAPAAGRTPDAAAHTMASLSTGMSLTSPEPSMAPRPCGSLPEAGLFHQGQHRCHSAKGVAHDGDFGQINAVLQNGEG